MDTNYLTNYWGYPGWQREEQAPEPDRIFVYPASAGDTEPPCFCDIKMLCSYGHENSCGYLKWKRAKA